MKWIKVSEQAPPHEEILVWTGCGKAHTVKYDYEDYHLSETCIYRDKEGTHPSWWQHGTGDSVTFTHWMPLPEKPKE